MITFLYVLLAILILLVMVTIHEFGHYIAGKILKFKIDEFAIGFGPKIFSKKRKNGEIFSIRALPLGGFCAFADETGEEETADSVFSEEKKSQEEHPVEQQEDYIKFIDQPPWKRIIVLIAGGVFNLLSAVVFSFIFILVAGTSNPVVNEILPSVDGTPTTILAGDIIREVDGKELNFMTSIAEALEGKTVGDKVEAKVERDGEVITITLSLREYLYETTENDETKTQTAVGIGITSTYLKATLGDAFKFCVPFTWELSWTVLDALGQLITGQIPISQLTGPIGTVETITTYSIMNWRYIILFLPLIAANLGIFNLLPIPALDGSKVVFALIEWIRKKPMNRKIENTIHAVGLILLFGLVIIIDFINLLT